MNTIRTIVTSFITRAHKFIGLRIVLPWSNYSFVQGCAPSLVSMDRSELELLKYQPLIHVVHYPPPSLVAKTASTDVGIVIGGVLGGFTAHAVGQAEGEKLKNQCSLEDPSIRTRETVIKSLS